MSSDVPIDEVLEKVKDSIVNQQTNESEKHEEKCSHHFGYLSKLPKSNSVPEECLLCSRVVDCMMGT
ncbi:MAG: hypothetical protein NWF06_09270 [Candidatus Bathyarchaeota archaeon]|nr:hypothetical protein [Candidatus Bathyarchaeum sp.]